MKKLTSIFLIALCIISLNACKEAQDLQKDATQSFDNLKDGVMETKENVENTVNQVKETADAVSDTVDKVKDVTDSVSNLTNNE